MSSFLGIDLGTTYLKAGLFTNDGGAFRLLRMSTRPMQALHAKAGHLSYDPETVWTGLREAIREVIQPESEQNPPVAVGIASMAEAGLLVDRDDGEPRTGMMPWFDPVSTPQAEALLEIVERQGKIERFCRAGIRPNFKCSLSKLLWLREANPGVEKKAVWLSMADWTAFRLTGIMATDYSLAGRTYAFRIDTKEWDAEWLHSLGLEAELFPPALPSGRSMGEVRTGFEDLGLRPGIAVSIAGHDHVVGAFAAGAVQPGTVFDSMGTAETLIGTMADDRLGEAEFHSGLVYGCHTAAERLYWLGGLSASGGSLEWLRSILGEPPLTYEEINSLLEELGRRRPAPSGILYFPYLSGSGSPHTDIHVQGAFAGLQAAHGRADLIKAVLEGTAYEVEFIRRTAEQAMGQPIETILAAGGGIRNPTWMQIKADVSGCQIEALPMPEATLTGAAVLAAVGGGFYRSQEEALGALSLNETRVYLPDMARHGAYREIYENEWLALQEGLRKMHSKQ